MRPGQANNNKEDDLDMVQGLARLAPLLLVILAMPARAEQAWDPISPEELKMTSEPKAPKASAVYLLRKVDRDDAQSTESVYVRIKVLTEEGRTQGNVEIPYTPPSESIRALQARAVKYANAAVSGVRPPDCVTASPSISTA